MTTASPTFSQIKAQVAAIRQKVPQARVIGIRAAGRWTGERLRQEGQETFQIDQCNSPLQMRMALQEDDGVAVKILLTSLEERDLGDDILVRLTKRRLFPMDRWQIVKALFQAREIDPRVTRHDWIAEALLDALPAGGFPPAPGGFLDAETVWPILLGQQIGLAGDRPDLLALLKWSIDAGQVERFRSTPEPFRQAALEWLAYQAGPAAEAVQSNSPASIEPLTASRQAIRRHDQAQRECRRLDRTQMALRLVRWLARAGSTANPSFPSFPSLVEAAAYHLAEGGFVDCARLSLCGGDPVRELSEAYAGLFDRVTAIREQQARRFSGLLRDWTAAGSAGDEVIPVEQILDEIVAPLATQAPVLVIVVDGMSAAVARELIADITRQDWVALCEDGRDTNRPRLAAMPSVTEVSRTSLLGGRLREGNAAVEKIGFSVHPELRAHCRSGSPPILFHKPSLQEADDASLAAEVRKEIGSSHRRVVGVVVNAIDDHLLKGEQIDTRWSRDEIKVLPTLLHEAKSARRLVVLLADHGHVLDHQTQGRPSEGRERWRIDNGKPAEDEVQIMGSRVVMPDDHRLIAPWTEKVRYGIKKNGYHGGLSPQEMVVPITVLCASDSFPAGWVEAPIDTPAWWDEPFQQRRPREEAPPRLKPIQAGGLGPLFDAAWGKREAANPAVAARPAEESIPAWIKALLASPILGEQKTLAGRTVPADEIIVKLLAALDRHGGKLASAALSRAIDYPAIRLRGLLAVMQRILNIGGYAVLTRNEASDTVELNRDLLCRQFDLVMGHESSVMGKGSKANDQGRRTGDR